MSFIVDGFLREQWISVAAYFKAEARGFEAGKELDDWLEAEADFTETQIQLFLLRSKEDGGMSILDLQTLASSVGVDQPEQFTVKVDLIHQIQKVSRQRPCFQSGYVKPCADLDAECQWRSECLKLIAAWHR